MRWFVSIRLCIICLLALLVSAPVWAEKTQVVIGVFADRGLTEARARWQPTITWLNQTLPDYQFSLEPLNLDALQAEITSQSLSFLIVNPSASIRTGRQYPLSWLTTLISPMAGGTTLSTGSAVWVVNTSNVTDWHQLSGRPIGTVDQRAFGGFMAFARDVVEQYDLNHYFSGLNELGFPHESVVASLLSGQVEAAILPICLVESMVAKGEISAEALRVLNPKTPRDAICQSSTVLYPNWGFAMTNKADRKLAKQIVLSLLAIPPTSNVAKAAQSLGWSVAEPQVGLDNLFSQLGVHPLQNSWWAELRNWLMVNYEITLLAFVVLAILPIQYLLLRRRHHRNTQTLQRVQQNLQLAQRRALVEKLGSSLAHELNQPLAAIRLYAEGELSRRRQGRTDTDIVALFEKIQRQTDRIDGVVSRFRSLLQRRITHKQLTALDDVVKDSIRLVEVYARQHKVTLQIGRWASQQIIVADKIAIEQLVVNLLTNAIDASAPSDSKGMKEGQVTIELLARPTSIDLIVDDNGSGLAQPFDTLLTPFVTTKAQGVGLGLAICKDVAESHSASFSLCNRPSSENGAVGCRASVCFPRIKS
ncbi:PhnD/SsuA/transferrin family substrate-binding protein [Vibrio sp. SM6]|uniref:histidine kinase n=1 Tax=Vibrio agarilyticus TaxID=2726741 RepID=A0A7X8YHM7_9VIBR|nr:PhnD/SsuA/transferrin family substrate-binding protein [Vibrio agarilyticus]NLS13750.1 PhnD/SsuA/transferrin family substrate-binding protein [Vibrio agarilyticus]